jgi:hypothetical protein
MTPSPIPWSILTFVPTTIDISVFRNRERFASASGLQK